MKEFLNIVLGSDGEPQISFQAATEITSNCRLLIGCSLSEALIAAEYGYRLATTLQDDYGRHRFLGEAGKNDMISNSNGFYETIEDEVTYEIAAWNTASICTHRIREMLLSSYSEHLRHGTEPDSGIGKDQAAFKKRPAKTV